MTRYVMFFCSTRLQGTPAHKHCVAHCLLLHWLQGSFIASCVDYQVHDTFACGTLLYPLLAMELTHAEEQLCDSLDRYILLPRAFILRPEPKKRRGDTHNMLLQLLVCAVSPVHFGIIFIVCRHLVSHCSPLWKPCCWQMYHCFEVMCLLVLQTVLAELF